MEVILENNLHTIILATAKEVARAAGSSFSFITSSGGTQPSSKTGV